MSATQQHRRPRHPGLGPAALLSVGLVAASGCDLQQSPEDGDPAAEDSSDETSRVDGESVVTVERIDELELRWTANGRIAAMFDRTRRPILLHEGEPLPALQRWAHAHAQELGLAANEPLPLELELDRTIDLGDGFVVYRYTQRYRGYPISGPDEIVSLTSLDGAVISIVGALSDSRVEFAGVAQVLDRELATHHALEHAGPDARLDSLSLVALSERGTVAWLARVQRPEGAVELGLAADSGALLFESRQASEGPFDHHPVNVLGTQFGANPVSPATTYYLGLPGSTWDGSWTSQLGWMLRMGNDRMAVYDFNLNNIDVEVPLAPEFYVDTDISDANFTEVPAEDALAFTTQDMFHKASVALTELDARKSTFGWDHHASTGLGLFTPGPINLFTNHEYISETGEKCDINADCLSNDCDGNVCRCNSNAECDANRVCVPEPWSIPGDGKVCRKPDYCEGSGGVYTFTQFGDSALQAPYLTIPTSNVFACDSSVSSLFHELGHYVDYHSAPGIMGKGAGNHCILGTTDEAIPLRETIGEMTSLYLLRQLYPTGYTLAFADTPCTFEDLGKGLDLIHHQSCINDAHELGWFPNDQAEFAPGGGGQCKYNAGYKVRSVNQAVWAWLNRQVCATSAPFACGLIGVPGTGEEFMDGMIYAMGLSNLQSYETFFENIETYLWAKHGAAVANSFRDVMSRYGILAP